MKRTRRVSVTELSSMGKCENMTRLKANHEERSHQSVRDAAERGQREHAAFERQGADQRCFVASWALGPQHWATEELRIFRDQWLARSAWGRRFITIYYERSPAWINTAKRVPGIRVLSARGLALIGWALRRTRQRREG